MDKGKYADIIDLPRPESKTRRRMPISERAAQFSPFAALDGFEERIQAASGYAEEFEQDEFRAELIEETLEALKLREKEQPWVVAVCFCGNGAGRGGKFSTVEGRLLKIDVRRKRLILEDAEIAFERIRELSFSND